MDDLSRVKRAADRASDFIGFRNTLQNEQNEKVAAERREQHKPHRHPSVEGVPPGPRLTGDRTTIMHTEQCKLARPTLQDPCTCGASRKYRLSRSDTIEAHLDSGGTMMHRNALELRNYWSQTERELTASLNAIDRLTARLNLAAETHGFDPEHVEKPRP